ncbi:hypothetical protein [Rubrivivax sp. A210]|uniref:hypothetical protein n=1 Tax=Rubrivivax sp. A210 TaxID=2772301 RepID=UPI001919616A|nr:hypothetical protein [Rubrivivax sp. A210]
MSRPARRLAEMRGIADYWRTRTGPPTGYALDSQSMHTLADRACRDLAAGLIGAGVAGPELTGGEPGNTSARTIETTVAPGQLGRLNCPPAPREPRPREAAAVQPATATAHGAEGMGPQARAQPEEPDTPERGAWTCGACGYRGFWSGGPHCLSIADADASDERGCIKGARADRQGRQQ